MVEVSCVRRWEKRNRTKFYCGVVKVCVGSIQYRGIDTFWDRKLRMHFLSDFFRSKCFRIFKTILHFSIFHEEIYFNTPDQNMSQGSKCFNTPIFCTTCVCVFILFHRVWRLLPSARCLIHTWGARINYVMFWLSFQVFLPSSFISISKNVIFHLHRQNSSSLTTEEKTI